MSLLLLQVTHTEQSMPPAYFPGRQGIIHAVDSGFLISNTIQSNGLRGAQSTMSGPKGGSQFGTNDLFWGREQN